MDCCGKSMLQKSRERSSAKKSLFGNFEAGHVASNEHYLERAGLRGRKLYLCWCIFVVVFLIALGHLAVTCFILGVLRFGVSGFSYIKFEGSSTIWPEGAALSNITIATPYSLNSFNNASITLSASEEESEIRLIAGDGQRGGLSSSHVSLSQSAVNLSIGAGGALNITHTQSGVQLVHGNASVLQTEELSVLAGVQSPAVTTHTTPSGRANLSGQLKELQPVSGVNTVRSTHQLLFRGAGGVGVRGSTVGIVSATSSGCVNITAREGVVLSGTRGIMMQGMAPSSSSSTTHHLCMRSDGTLFAVPSNPLRCRMGSK